MKTRLTEQSARKSLSEFNPHTNYRERTEVFYIYLLKSDKDKDLYLGYTNNLERRIKEHNNSLVPSTKLRIPFDLIYCEGYKSEQDARHRENNLKLHSRAFAQLKKRLEYSMK